MQVREILVNEKDNWNNFVAASPVGDLLQSYEWGELKKRSGGWEPIRIAAFEGGEIRAAISILKRRIPHTGRCIFYASRGPVLDLTNSKLLSELLDGIRIRAAKEGAILLKIDPPVVADDTESLASIAGTGFVKVQDATGFGGIQPRCVMQLDLTPSLDEILANCKPKWRYNIRLAEKKGVTVRSDCEKNDLRAFYEILKETAVRDKFLVRGFSYYEHMWDLLVETGYARLFLTEYEGEVVSGALSFLFGDKCWYTYGASSNRHRNVMPNHLMQWTMIGWAKESGCKWYDFRGVSPQKEEDPNDHLYGLNRFKEGFGAKFVEYIGEYDIVYSDAWYWAWTQGKPRISNLFKSLRRRKSGSASSSDGM